MQNYTGFGRIKIGGKERPFYYGVAAGEFWRDLRKAELKEEGIIRDVEFWEFQEAIKLAFGYEEKDDDGNVIKVHGFNPFHARKFVQACLLAGYEYAEEPLDFKPGRVKFWLQEFTPETWQAVVEVVMGANQSPNDLAPEQTMTVQ